VVLRRASWRCFGVLFWLFLTARCMQAKFKSPSLTLEQIDSLAQEFLEAMEKGTFKDQGWPQSAYGVSKVLLRRVHAGASA